MTDDIFQDATFVTFAVPDLNGQARGKRLPGHQGPKLLKGNAKMPLSVLSVDILGNDVADSPLVFDTGDQDGVLRPTERGVLPMPWLTEDALLLPMSMYTKDEVSFEGDPRHALAHVLKRYHARGWTVQAATELEFFIVADNAPSPLAARLGRGGDILGLQSLDAYDRFLSDLYAGCRAMGIAADTASSESGRGQFEVTLAHGDALKAADDTWLFKMLAKGLAQRHGLAATFMAKPHLDDAGNGLHLHFSVLDQDGRNIFDNGTAEGSALLLYAIAGCLDAMEDTTLIFAPHQNSYLRLVPGAHAPTSVCWAYENRTAAIRVPESPNAARRIEHRVAGGDTNPYLLMAAILGSALSGIENELEPPPPITGNAYELDGPSLAPDWASAIARFKGSPWMAQVFPALMINLMVRSKHQDRLLTADLSDGELIDLYFDRV